VRSRYSNAGEIVIMTIAWAVVLVVLAKTFESHVEPLVNPAATSPEISMFVRHIGCSDQQERQVIQALAGLPWLGGATITPDHPWETPEEKEAEPEEPCSAFVTTPVEDVKQADFMQLIKTLYDIGIAPKAIEFGGLADFALMANVSDLSCKSCKRAALEALTPLKVSVTYYATTNQGEIDPSRITSFTWLESKSLNQSAHTITAKVHRNSSARVSEMVRALEGAGFLPLSVRIMITKTEKPA
jgi:hypothetical protein